MGVFGELNAAIARSAKTPDSRGDGRMDRGGSWAAWVAMAEWLAGPSQPAWLRWPRQRAPAPEDSIAAGSARHVEGQPGIRWYREAHNSVQPVVRTNFADTAFWMAALTTVPDGTAEVEFPLPDSLTTWKVKSWAMGPGTKVGQAESEIVTTKDLLVRLQAPRFFVEKDEVVLSANVHNKLKNKKTVQVVLELDGSVLRATGRVGPDRRDCGRV